MNANLQNYGFKPHDASEGVTTEETEKTVSCKVTPEVWNRWKRAQQRLAAHGDVQLAAVVRCAFLKALDELEIAADELQNARPPVRAEGGKAK
jgi:hypothetical protein